MPIVEPEVAYLCEEDAQKLAIARRMVRAPDFPVEVVAVPTVRAEDGLALSSRNACLSPEEPAAATLLHLAPDLGRLRTAGRVVDVEAALRGAAEAGWFWRG